ncbi:MAG: hypothetical protein Q9208_002027 [Pyrenodesmia sp. 3 TL-2023]
MRIATLQFSPKLGLLEENIAHAESLLFSAPPASLHNLDLLVLPELAFTGYNHPSLRSIKPHLEPPIQGPSTQWALRTAARLQCLVTVGYPEIASPSPPSPSALRPTMIDLGPGREGYYTLTAYNAVVTVNPSGEVVARYRKSNLYYTDEVWAQEGPDGFVTHDVVFDGKLDLSSSRMPAEERAIADMEGTARTIRTTFAICMDLNPHHFLPSGSSSRTSLSAHVLSTNSRMLILSTAWLTHLPASALVENPERPDMDTLGYWFDMLMPLINHDQDFTCAFANRCGEEPGKAVPDVLGGDVEERGGEGVRYAGSSWVGLVGNGRVRVGRVMGRAEEGVQVVDTEVLGKGGGWEVEFRERG